MTTESTNPADVRKAELLAEYPDWCVTNPGKYEGCTIEAIYFHELALDGGSDEQIATGYIFAIDTEDRARWELRADTAYVVIEEDSQGFVTLSELTNAEYQRLQDDSTEAAGPQDDDLTTEDHRTFYHNGKAVLARRTRTAGGDWWEYWHDRAWHRLTVTVPDDHVAALHAYMDHVQYWPNVWFISDHGNVHRIDLTGNRE